MYEFDIIFSVELLACLLGVRVKIHLNFIYEIIESTRFQSCNEDLVQLGGIKKEI